MSVSSMTGFARADGSFGGAAWHWEIKSVNGRGLDVRCRLAQGFEALEADVRERAAAHFRRGNLQVLLQFRREPVAAVAVNEPVLARIVEIAEGLRTKLGAEPIRVEALLQLRGVLELAEPGLEETDTAPRKTAMLASLDEALSGLAAMRLAEGARLKAVIEGQLDRVQALTEAARDCPERSPETIRAKLAADIARILEASPALDADRLHQEAVFIAQRADIQEEVDRLFAHVTAARQLLEGAEPAGRRFDFLAQEFNREANTLCSKAPGQELVRIGLELKATIDQLREQVQNLE